MVRTRVIQTLFAYYKDSDKTVTTARKELTKSFADTYDLYFMLLDFINELTAYAQQQLEEQIGRARATHLSWDSGMPAVVEIYRQLTESDFYNEYMNAETCTYEDDKRLWRLIFQHLLANSETLNDALDELEVVLDKANWTTDADVVISYVIKTIKRYQEDSTPDTPLLEMFDNEDELDFAKKLLETSLKGHEEYEQLINAHLKGWDADRIAYMDRIILETALAEILEFEDIALTVSMNEYIELAKEYSGDKSYMFINGILTEILRELKHDGSCMKALTLK